MKGLSINPLLLPLCRSIGNSGLIQFQVPSSCAVTYTEHVVVNTSITIHGRRGDVQLKLRSPKHTESVVLPKRRADYKANDISHWPFMTVASWGEDPRGVWSMTIQTSGSATATEMELSVFGTADTPVAMKRTPRDQCHAQCRSGCVKEGAEFCDDCLHYRVNSSRECVEECPAGTYAEHDVCWPCDPVCLTCTGPGAASCSTCSPDARTVNGQCLPGTDHMNQTTAPSEGVQPSLTSHVVAPKTSAQRPQSTSLSIDTKVTDSQNSLPGSIPLPSLAVAPPLDSTSSVITPASKSSVVTSGSTSSAIASGSTSSAVTPEPFPSATEGHSQLVKEGPHAVTSGGHFPPLSSETSMPVVTNLPSPIMPKLPQPLLCEAGCERCSTPQRCVLCKLGMVLLGDKCVSGCEEGYTEVKGRCTPCADSHCSQCQATRRCDTCVEGYYLSSYGLCQQCDEGCARCSGKGACLECRAGATQCVQNAAAQQHKYSTVIGLAVVGTCLLILVVTGVLIVTILCKHRLRVGGRMKDVRYKRVRKEMESESDEELYGQ